MVDFIFRFTFRLQNIQDVCIARKEFGALLKRLNLKYKSKKNFHPWRCSPPATGRLWELDFLILPPEYQKTVIWKIFEP
jgi:hypothetical protein